MAVTATEIQKRVLGRQQRAADSDARRRSTSARYSRALRCGGGVAETGPEVDALRAREHGVEHEHREEIGVADLRRVVRKLQIRRRAFLFEC